MSLTDAERADIEELPPPLRDLALNASDGSYSNVQALHEYLQSPWVLGFIDEHVCLALVPVLLVGLDPNDVPDSPPMDPAAELLVLRAFRCIDFIAVFALKLMVPVKSYSTLVCNNHERIFSWLNYLMTHYFIVGEAPPPDSQLAVITEGWIVKTIAGTLKALDMSIIKFQPGRHDFIVDVVVGAWRKLLYVDLVSMNIFTTALVINLTGLFMHMLRSPIYLTVIDKAGGRSSFLALFLTHVEYGAQRLVIHSDDFFDVTGRFKEAALLVYGMFSSVFHDREFLPEVARHDAIPRASVVVNLFIDRLNTIQRKGGQHDGSLIDDISKAIHSYCDVVMADTWSNSPPFLLQSLKSGTPRNLRVRTATMRSSGHPLYRETFVTYISMHSVYPAILKHATKVLQSRPKGSKSAAWTKFDQLVTDSLLMWRTVSKLAQQLDRCSTCAVPRTQLELKLCGGCRTVSYCSYKCQRTGWHKGHRLHCKLLQFSEAHSPLIGGCHGILFLALLETFQIAHHKRHLTNLLSSTPFRPNEIPLILVEMATSIEIKIARMADYPHIFGDEVWEKELIPGFRAMMDAKQMPRYLTVLAMPQGMRRSYVLGAVASSIVSGLLDWNTLTRMEKMKGG